MAITKTNLFGDNLTPLFEFLQTNGIPTYFDAVTSTSDDNGNIFTISCMVDDVEFLKFSSDYAGSSSAADVAHIYITTATGFIKYLNVASSYPHCNMGFVCKGGIALSFSNSQPEEENEIFGLTITKDNAERTTVVLTQNPIADYGSSSYYPWRNVQAISVDDLTDGNKISIQPNADTPYDAARNTVMVPYTTGHSAGDMRYTPTVQHMLYTQFPQMACTFAIDGVKYLSNGTTVIKDE